MSVLVSARRHTRGQSLVELAAGLMVMLPVILVLVDLAIITTAITANDAACRDAARVAAAGEPVGNNVEDRAKQVLKQAYQSGGYITGPTLVEAKGVGIVAPDATYGGPYQGKVSVETEIVVRVPASIPGITPENVTLHSKQEFPVTFVKQNTFSPL